MKAIINREQNFGTLNGVIAKNEEIRKVINQHLKQGTAKLLVDTDETLMYDLGERPIHQILGYPRFVDFANDGRNHMG